MPEVSSMIVTVYATPEERKNGRPQTICSRNFPFAPPTTRDCGRFLTPGASQWVLSQLELGREVLVTPDWK